MPFQTNPVTRCLSLLEVACNHAGITLERAAGVLVGVLGSVAILSIMVWFEIAEERHRENDYRARNFLATFSIQQDQYAAGPGKGNYTDDGKGLGCFFAKCFPCAGECLLPTSLPRNGYSLGPVRVKAATATAPARYWAYMRPIQPTGINRTGNDIFYVDETGVIRHSGSPTVWPDKDSAPVR